MRWDDWNEFELDDMLCVYVCLCVFMRVLVCALCVCTYGCMCVFVCVYVSRCLLVCEGVSVTCSGWAGTCPYCVCKCEYMRVECEDICGLSVNEYTFFERTRTC